MTPFRLILCVCLLWPALAHAQNIGRPEQVDAVEAGAPGPGFGQGGAEAESAAEDAAGEGEAASEDAADAADEAAVEETAPEELIEQAVMLPPPGFSVVFEEGSALDFVVEYVPSHESIDDWTELRTHQRLTAHAGADPVGFLASVADQMRSTCPGMNVQTLAGAVAGGYPNATIYGSCPGADWFVMVAISGDQAMHVLGHTWLGDPGQAIFVNRFSELSLIPLCEAERNPDPCP